MRIAIGAVGLGVLLGLGTAVALATGPQGRSQSPSAVEVYDALRLDASRGDGRAAEMVAALDDYLASRSMAVADLEVPSIATAERVEQGALQLRIKDMGPWSITIVNDSPIASADDLRAYVALRTAALRQLAAAAPDRQLNVVASPASLVSASDFLGALACDCAAESIVVDVFADGNWIMASGRVLSGFADTTALEADLRGQVAVSLDQFPGVSSEDLRITVRSVRLSMPASTAARLSGDEHILLLDPLDDIKDRFAGRAAFVEVTSAPDVFRKYAEVRLGVRLDVSELVPVKPEGGK